MKRGSRGVDPSLLLGLFKFRTDVNRVVRAGPQSASDDDRSEHTRICGGSFRLKG